MPKIKSFFAFLYHIHQYLGLAMSLAIIAWALSGLAHPIITRLNPQPVEFSAPQAVVELSRVKDIAELIAQKNINELQHVRLFQWLDKPVYRIESEQGVQYFSAVDLQEIGSGDARYAEFLARHFVGDTKSNIRQLKNITGYDASYNYVNRYLPVVRVDFDRGDNMQAYIDTRQGRLATLGNNKKRFTSAAFGFLHTWSWLNDSALRKTLMMVFLCAGFLVSLMGFVLYIKSRRLGTFRKEHPRARRWHRNLAAIIALPTMCFSLSGILHLVLIDEPATSTTAAELHIPAAQIALDASRINAPVESIQLTQIEQELYWLVAPLKQKKMAPDAHHETHNAHANHDAVPKKSTDEPFYLSLKTGGIIDNGAELHSRYLAKTFSGFAASNITHIKTITGFGGEYGFINKRLPVQAVSYALENSPSIYIELKSNSLATVVTNSARIEGYSFAYLHKWHFLDFLGKNIRDFVVSLVALTLIVTIVLGAYRFVKNR